MSSGYYKASKPELVAIYHLEFYKNKKKWKLSDEKNKKPALPSGGANILKPESDKNLNKTYNVDIDPAVEKEKNSPLNSAFIHEIPFDEEPQEAEDAGPPPPTPQPSEEAWPETADQPDIQKLWIKDQEDTDSLKVLQNSQEPDIWTNPSTEGGPLIQNPTKEDETSFQSLLRSNNTESLPQSPANLDLTKQTKPTVTQKSQDDWIKQEMTKLWSEEAALLKQMMQRGQWDIPPPSLPNFLKVKGLIGSSDVPDGPSRNQGSLKGQAKPQAPSSDCLKMLLCPNDWIKKNNEHKAQNQDQMSGPIAWPNDAPESDPHYDQAPKSWINEGVPYQKVNANIWTNQLSPSDPSFNINTGPETWNNIEMQKFNSQIYNNYQPDKQSTPVLETPQMPQAIPNPDIGSDDENISPQCHSNMWTGPPASGTIPDTTAGPVAWAKQDINANNILSSYPINTEPNSAPFYNNANPDIWVNQENSKKYHPYPSQKSASSSSSNANFNTPPNAWMKGNGTKYPPNKWVNPALESGSIENWRNRENNSKPHPDNWPIPVTTSGLPSKTTPDNWRIKENTQNCRPAGWTNPALAATTSTPSENKDNCHKFNPVPWTNQPVNGPQIRQDALNNQGSPAKLHQPQISGQIRPQQIQISGNNIPNLSEKCQEEAWLYQQGQKTPYIWTEPGIHPVMEAQNMWTDKAWLEQQKIWQNANKNWCTPAEGAPDVMYEEIAGQYMPVDQQTLKPLSPMDDMQSPTQIRKNTEKWLRRLLAIYRPNEDPEDDQVHNESIHFVREAHEVPHSSENDPNESRECVCSFVSPAALPALTSQLLSTAILHATKSLHAVLKEQLIRDQLRARTLMKLQEFPTRDVEVFPELKDGSHLPHPTSELEVEKDGLIRIAMGRPYRLTNAN